MNLFFNFSHRRFFRRSLVIMCLLWLSACSQSIAPPVSFTDIRGNQLNLEQMKGKVVIVNFWATSCSTCVAEMPDMIKTYDKYHAEGLEFIAVAMSYDPPNYVLNFTETRQLPFTVVLDVDGQLAKSFGDIKLTPTTFIIDTQGNIIKKYVGAPEFSQMNELIETQLQARRHV